MKASTPPFAEDRARGRPRDEPTRRAILAAAHSLLGDDGFDRLSIEGVAARAGVGKSTIYRWWPSKGALAVESFLAHVAPDIAFPETASAQTDILAQMRRLARAYTGKTGQFVREMIGSGQLQPEILAMFWDGYLEPRREAARTAIRRGVAQGEFRADVDIEAMIDALYGPLFYRMLLQRSKNSEGFVATVAAGVFAHVKAAR